ncbi:efflux RND transporter permease subunit [Leptolyngbya sp. NK1-12]|uniref:Efflux RND transporter permease subunit n=1 Tax=Leptolyngbya sp. NK1-12 TaxID=2547451 RepID=A0AA96WXN3_9CYAN|nr:efflux RND transporter permease subunit [Leptolyngbya sp. NK1-12]WNZ26337.1 efflux RND transporter permease subunit [Leptolyngbya sp. NK1-12]
MSFHLSEWSIKRPVPVLVISLVLMVMGLFAFFHLGIDADPNIDIPGVVVYVRQSGAAATELETQVTKRVEDAVAGLGNIDQITSEVQDEQSVTRIEFNLGIDVDRATNDVRNAIAQIRSFLPQDIDEPIINRLEFTESSIMTYVVAAKTRSVEDLSYLVDQTISPALLNVEGVAQVERWGGVDREVQIELDPNRLLALGLTVNQVNDQIRAFNVNLPSGRTALSGGEQSVRSLGSADSIPALQRYRINLPDGATVPLATLGTVTDGSAEPRQAARFNGEPVVSLAVKRSSGASIVSVEEAVRQAVAKLQPTLPEDVELRLVFTLADFIRASYRDIIIDTLILGSIFTVITVGIFLRNWRATWVTALSLPLSIIPTFAVMQMLGYSLNSMTLLGLGLAIGNLIDDSVCVIDIIDQHLLMGKRTLRAALDGAKEISLAIAATTAVIIAVFLPVAFMGGIPGQFFRPFGITISVASIFSTLVACTVTPMLAAHLLKSKSLISSSLHPSISSPIYSPYRFLLTAALRHRCFTLLLAIAIFIGSLQLIPLIPKGLLNNGNSSYSLAAIELPPGSPLSETEIVMQQVTQRLQNHPAVENVLATAYRVDYANLFINLVPRAQRVSRQQFEAEMRTEFAQIPGARVSFRSQGVRGDKDLSMVLKSNNGEALTQVSQRLEQEMRQIPGLVEVTSSNALVRPELVIRPDPDRAADLGVSVASIAEITAVALQGDAAANLAQFNLPDRQIPIRVKLITDARTNLDTLKQLRIESQQGTLVPLSAVADIRLGGGLATIERVDRARQVSVEANLEGLALGDALDRVRALPVLNTLPPDVLEQSGGDAEIMQEIFARFATVLTLSILCIYAILVLLYNHFFYPVVILSAIPLSIGGALLALMITQKELGLFALIGMVLLLALVTKNAILLVDFALIEVQRGLAPFKAVVEAGISRFRPIMMTSVSTVIGMVPIALGLGAAGDTRSPMAIAVIGGFTTSTLLTLVVVPVWFTYVDQWANRLKTLSKRRSSASDVG